MTNMRSKIALALSRELNNLVSNNWKTVHDMLKSSNDPNALGLIVSLTLQLDQAGVDDIMGSYFENYMPGTINLTITVAPTNDGKFDATNLTYRYRGTALEPDLHEYMGQGPDIPMPDMVDVLEAVIEQDTFEPTIHNPLYVEEGDEPAEMDIAGPTPENVSNEDTDANTDADE